MEKIEDKEFNNRLGEIAKLLKTRPDLAHAFANLVQDNITMQQQIISLQKSIKEMRDIHETLKKIRENKDEQ